MSGGGVQSRQEVRLTDKIHILIPNFSREPIGAMRSRSVLFV